MNSKNKRQQFYALQINLVSRTDLTWYAQVGDILLPLLGFKDELMYLQIYTHFFTLETLSMEVVTQPLYV